MRARGITECISASRHSCSVFYARGLEIDFFPKGTKKKKTKSAARARPNTTSAVSSDRAGNHLSFYVRPRRLFLSGNVALHSGRF